MDLATAVRAASWLLTSKASRGSTGFNARSSRDDSVTNSATVASGRVHSTATVASSAAIAFAMSSDLLAESSESCPRRWYSASSSGVEKLVRVSMKRAMKSSSRPSMDATSASFPTPPRMNLMVGRALTLKREARRSHESTLARRNLALGVSRARRRKSGANERHGPHHSAWKSMMKRLPLCPATSSSRWISSSRSMGGSPETLVANS
mmetsp:Transcript_47132/g.111095  ORF Transcript_47132/g.111095 Transcript_47132/m.111095 type:complete len:208 (+) Transcript_47132:2419-3042(+)